MLDEHEVGIPFLGVNIKCLLWAGDIVLIADEHDLQRMLKFALIFPVNCICNSIMKTQMFLLFVSVPIGIDSGNLVMITYPKFNMQVFRRTDYQKSS